MQISAVKNILLQIQKISQQSQFKQLVQLVAVSKTKPVEQILEVYSEGQRDFGENYVDEVIEKAEKLPKDIKWHFIGHLQSNKVATLMKVENLDYIHTIDTIKLASKINKYCEANNRSIKVLVQVKLSEEVSKSGATEEESIHLIQEIITLNKLEFIGLMTIGPQGDVAIFRQLYKFKEYVENKFNIQNLQLSMGMSGDFEPAILEGANIVRIGSAIFGDRH
ncbi:hypothetical protein pb186bvf_004805 [Paramecium bursaria]